MKKYLYYFRDNPNRDIPTDVEWAVFRFLRRFQKEPTVLLVNPNEADKFVGLNLKVKIDNKVSEGVFGVE